MPVNPPHLSFSNENIDLSTLPKYEDLALTKPHPSYWKIICINLAVVFTLLAIGGVLLVVFVDELRPKVFLFAGMYLLVASVSFLLSRAGFKKRGYALRHHDVIYKSGILAETTTIIPLNRIQHIELNEGIFSRMYQLGTLQIFTAGGQTGHLRISGIPITEAKSIRDVLLKKLHLIEETHAENSNHE